ncbi:MAG: alpha/beta fold hydrolase [Deltaproteobacteria bacterium]|nr:alpha/beta fold hydrolase [Deltaproteobacteria bacterium]
MLSRILGRKKPPASELEQALEHAVRGRVLRPSDRTAARRVRIVFEAHDAATWSIDIRDGKVSLWKGRAADADVVITSDAKTITDVLENRVPGVQAFLEGRLFMRGNVALALELDDLLHPHARDPRSPRFHRVGVAGVRAAYLEAGTPGAPPVVLLHGLGATSASFLPLQWELARDHHVFAIDFPGFGESDKPIRPLHAPYFAKWVRAWLDTVGIARAHVIGNSMGGRAALELGLRSPERVDRLVLLAPSLAWRRYRFAQGLVRIVRPELGALPMRVLHGVVVRSLHTMFSKPERIPRAATYAAADEFTRIFATPRGRIAFFHAAREVYLDDAHGSRGFWDRLPTLSRPALFIFGDRDRLVPPGFMKHVQRALPDAEYEMFDDCGHVPQFELPERTSARIRAFFAKADQRGAR